MTKIKLKIRLIKEEEISSLRQLLIITYSSSFESVYPASWIKSCINNQTTERLSNKIRNTHFYGAYDEEKLIGCAAIGSYYGKADESCLFSFCVAPNLQGQGIGKALMNAIECDEYFTRANKIFCPSSIVALPFYLKMGFNHCEDKLNYQDGSFLLELTKIKGKEKQ